MYGGINDVHGDFSMTINVFTSDEETFKLISSPSLTGVSMEEIGANLIAIYDKLTEKDVPKMVMSFFASTPTFSGDNLMDTVNNYPKKFPLFGTNAFNDENIAENNLILCGDIITHEIVAFLGIYGDFKPHFHSCTSFAYEESVTESARITKCYNNIVMEINGLPATDYLTKIGMVDSSGLVRDASIWAVPAIVKFSDGNKVARAFFGIVEGTNHIFSAGRLEEGAEISFASMDSDKTVRSAEKLFNEVLQSDDKNCICFSCAARFWSLGRNKLAELEKVESCVNNAVSESGEKLNYSLVYSGGEICPMFNENGDFKNIMHTYTITACTF
jgi:hypothetical protein